MIFCIFSVPHLFIGYFFFSSVTFFYSICRGSFEGLISVLTYGTVSLSSSMVWWKTRQYFLYYHKLSFVWGKTGQCCQLFYSICLGSFDGLIGILAYGAVSLVLWYGGKLVNEKVLSAGVLTCKSVICLYFQHLYKNVHYTALHSDNNILNLRWFRFALGQQ